MTYQLKILTTALFSVVLLNKQLSPPQWVSLLLLFVGVSAVQLQPHDAKATDQAQEQNPLVGLIAVIVSAIMSGFAGVYFEKILKGTKQTIWLRNVQLGSLGIVFGSITMVANDWQAINEKGFFFGYDIVVWIVVLLNSLAGLLIAIVIKYADNILKGFATSAAIILSCIASIYLFDFQLSPQFLVGTCFVMTSVYMYSKYVPVAVVDPSKPMMKV